MTTEKEIGQLLSAGTNCGSCVPELNELLRRHRPADTASPAGETVAAIAG